MTQVNILMRQKQITDSEKRLVAAKRVRVLGKEGLGVWD